MPRETCVEILSTGRCKKKVIKGSDRCIFHHPEMWKHKPELVLVKLRTQISRGDFNFHGYHLPDIDFSELVHKNEFKHPVRFIDTHFHGITKFRQFRFLKPAYFFGAQFSEEVDFRKAHFCGYAGFSDAQFSGSARFSGTKFGDVSFKGARFICDSDFEAEFYGGTFFNNVEFHGSAHFMGAKFHDHTEFSYTKFIRYVGFNWAAFHKDTTFFFSEFAQRAEFYKTEFQQDADFRHCKFSDDVNFGNAKFFHNAYFMNTKFAGNLSLLGVTIDRILFDFSFAIFQRELLVDESQWILKNYRLKIENTDLEGAIRNYHLLKKVFLAMGHYRVAGDVYYNEMACRRKLLSKSLKKFLPSLSDTAKSICNGPPLKDVVKSPLLRRIREIRVVKEVLSRISRRDISNRDSRHKGSFWKQFFDWLWMQIFYFTCGFGERPLRVLGLSLATIFMFAFAYCLLIPTSTLKAFYLSCDCFVTLGIFKSEAVAIKYQWLTYLEAGLGLFMMSLFLVVFSRKMTRD